MTDGVDFEQIADFSNPDQEKIYERLRLLGEGPAASYKDRCRILHPQNKGSFATTVHLVNHLQREIESAFIDVILHASGKPIPTGAGKHRANKRIVLEFLGIPDADGLAQYWLSLDLHEQSHRAALSYRRVTPDFLDECLRFDQLFVALLQRFQENYLLAHQNIERLISLDSPTNDDLTELRGKIPNSPIAFAQFFVNASPNWLNLKKFREAYFKQPPEIVYGYFSYWSESQYLARCTESNPDEVLEVVLQVPRTTNPSVVHDLFEIAYKLPVSSAVSLYPALLDHLKQVQGISPTHPTLLINRFIQFGEYDKASSLMEELFRPILHTDSDAPHYYKKSLTAKFNDFYYLKSLHEIAVTIIKCGWIDGIDVLVALLNSAMGSLWGDQERELSYWRKQIPQPNYNTTSSIEDTLVTELYQLVAQFSEAGVSVDEIVRRIGNHNWMIIRRIMLKVLSNANDVTHELLSACLVSEQNFRDWSPEYFEVLSSRFSELSPYEQQQILEMISSISTNEALSVNGRKYRQAQALQYIKHSLPPNWQSQFDALKAEIESIEPIGYFPPVTAMWTGPTSPLSTEEIASKSVEELSSFLQTWIPIDEFMSASREGLGRNLSSTVALAPEDYARNAVLFQQIHPTYVRSLLSGLRDACRDGKSFDWEPVIKLCAWIADQQDSGAQNSRATDDSDPNWSWTRGEIGHLLETGFVKDSIPVALRKYSWQVLERLIQDPEPDLEQDARYQKNNSMSFYEASLNTNRAIAFHAAFQYALWCKRNLMKTIPKEELMNGFTLMPEISAVLETNLANDTSPIVRSVYGRYLPYIYSLDKNWARANLEKILPHADEYLSLFFSSWDTYLLYCEFFSDLYSIFETEYIFAVHHMGREVDDYPLHNPNYRLSEHLAIFYWRGLIELDGDLLTEFFAQGQDAIYANMIRYIGQQIKNLEDTEIERLMALWLQRIEQANGNPDRHIQEMQSFGWWLISEKGLENRWKLEQAINVLELVFKFEPTYQVLVWLSEQAEAYPNQVAKCLCKFLQNSEYWEIERSKTQIRAAIENIGQFANSPSKTSLRGVINILAANGDMRFADLLPNLNDSQ